MPDDFDADLARFAEEFLPSVQGSVYYPRWVKASPVDAARWVAFRDALLAGQIPAVPNMSTKFGKALVAGGELHMSVSRIVGMVRGTGDNPAPPLPPEEPPPTVFPFYIADFEVGDTSQLYSLQQYTPGRIVAVGSPLNISGNYSCRFINGVNDYVSGGHRTEAMVQAKIVTSFFGGNVGLEGRETWFTWKFQLDPNYEEPLGTWGLITQFWTNGLANGSPCLAFENPRVSPSSRARLQVIMRGGVGGVTAGEAASNYRAYVVQNPVSLGVVHHVKVYRKWSCLGSVGSSPGSTKVWWYIDGQSVPSDPAVDDTGPNFCTSYPNDPYHKCGIYRSTSGITRDSYVLFDDIKYWLSDPGDF